jgi:hypothetical protein
MGRKQIRPHSPGVSFDIQTQPLKHGTPPRSNGRLHDGIHGFIDIRIIQTQPPVEVNDSLVNQGA